MDIPARIQEYESRLKAEGISLRVVLDGASVDRSTWTRWKGIPSKPPQLPSMSKWQAVEREMDRVIAERRSEPQPVEAAE